MLHDACSTFEWATDMAPYRYLTINIIKSLDRIALNI